MRRTLLATKIVEVGLLAPIAAPDLARRHPARAHRHGDAARGRHPHDTRSGPCSTSCSTAPPSPTSRWSTRRSSRSSPRSTSCRPDDRGAAYTEALRGSAHRSVVDGGGLVVAVGFYLVIVGDAVGAVARRGRRQRRRPRAATAPWPSPGTSITSEAAIVSVNARHIEDDRHRHRPGHGGRGAAAAGLGARRPRGQPRSVAALPEGGVAVGGRRRPRHDRRRGTARARPPSSSWRRASCWPSRPTCSPSTPWPPSRSGSGTRARCGSST